MGRGLGGRDFPGLPSWLRAVQHRVARPHEDNAEVRSLPEERGPWLAFPGTHREAGNSSASRGAAPPLTPAGPLAEGCVVDRRGRLGFQRGSGAAGLLCA